MSIRPTIDWSPLAEIIDQHRSFLITSHCRADCDALGSELGMARLLEALGKQTLIVNGDELPDHIAFLDTEDRVRVVGLTAPLESLRGFEVLVIVDTSARAQLGPMLEVVDNFAGPRVIIDHHLSSDDLGAVVFRDVQAEATGRLILELADHLKVELTRPMADAMFAAIATDTGWFRFSSVNELTFRALARLVEAGASPPEMFAQLFEQHSLPRLHLRGRIFSHVTPECDGRLMWTYVTAEDFSETSAQQADTEDSINGLLSVAGVEAAAMFVELQPQLTKVSLRSRGALDVRAVAEQFGGGGHQAAAGITLYLARQDAQQAVLDALRGAMT
jgi:phosphoesterase RecJ-like protein